jgi:tripartite ATP-independent transporter DctP family solute receptor
MIDRKSVSFLCVGLLVGVLSTSAAFALLMRPSPQSSGATGSSAAASQASHTVLKLAHALDQSHPVHAAMVFMAERLAQKSSGQVELKIFPNGQLGSETDSIEQVQRGALAMAKTSAAALEGFVPEMALFGLPYLFRDDAHYWQVLEGPIGRHLLAAGEGVGLHGLCYYDSGSRSFYTTGSPILTPDDLTGRKIRVMRSKTAMDMISQMGGAPTPIPWGELYTALQQGMVDGAENNAPSLKSSRHFEVTKYYSLDEHTRIPDLVVFSQTIWKSLSPEIQEWVRQSAAESVTFQRKLWNEETAAALTSLKAAGVEVHRPDTAPFVKKVSPMYDRLEGGPLAPLVREIRAL